MPDAYATCSGRMPGRSARRGEPTCHSRRFGGKRDAINNRIGEAIDTGVHLAVLCCLGEEAGGIVGVPQDGTSL